MKVTVIIPYKTDRGWLQEAINSVPQDVQCLVSQGEGNWPENFNKAYPKATGDFIRYLHEDDMLTENCVRDSVAAIKYFNADFIHGNAIEYYQHNGHQVLWKPQIKTPTLKDMLVRNYIHSASVMYRREVFEKVGLYDERLNTAEEYEFHLRCLQAGLKLGYVDSPLAYYRRHPAQKVRVVPVKIKDMEREMVRNKYRV